MKFFALACAFLAAASPLPAQVLFDATKAEMAGNADWVIDADLHNLGVSSASDGSGVVGGGNESNPQRVPTPAVSGITANTAETYWTGALSAWAVALAKRGQTLLETLPVFLATGSSTRSRITYGDGTNAQDLSHYRMFVVCEPNIAFTAAEKTAILSYVKAGGSLFIVADHGQSDRNNDGIDSPAVWNDLFTSNSVQTAPFGFSFNADDVSPATESADTTATNPLTHGPAGTITQFKYSSGSTMTITNAKVAHAAVWQTSSHSSSQVMALYGTFGAGKFVAVGDSSPIDDGTGDPNDTLFDGWDDAGGNDGQLILNASIWLLLPPPTATTGAASAITPTSATLNATVNPQGQATTVQFQYGTTSSYGSTTTAQSVGSGSADVAATANIASLAASTTYHFSVLATNGTVTVNGADAMFTTAPPPPSAVTNAVSGTASTVATLNASVDPNGIATTYHFDFGTTTAYGFSSVERSAGAGSTALPESLLVNGLATGTTYHYRVTITSAAGVVSGSDASFTTAPLVDADGDGLPDDYETAHGLDPNDARDAVLDPDGDGMSNLREYLAGTDPRDGRDWFHVATVTTSGANVLLTFPTVFGKHYAVESATNPAATTWTAVGATINGNGAVQPVTDTGGVKGGRPFYRVRIVP